MLLPPRVRRMNRQKARTAKTFLCFARLAVSRSMPSATRNGWFLSFLASH